MTSVLIISPSSELRCFKEELVVKRQAHLIASASKDIQMDLYTSQHEFLHQVYPSS